MATPSVVATNFTINRLILTSAAGNKVDIKYLIYEFNIYEDIFANSISGDVVMHDALGLIHNLPIYGFETLDISFNTPTKANYEKTFRVYKISHRKPTKEREEAYIIHFTSFEEMTNASVNVSKAYKGKLISDVANDIQTAYLNSSFANIETTQNLHHFVMPNRSPFELMNWLANRAISANYSGATYQYFQNQRGYNFVSIESLVDGNGVSGNYLFQPANARIQNAAGDWKPRDPDDTIAVQEYEIDNHIDSLENIASGMYANRVMTHNIVRKVFANTDYNYLAKYPNYRHVEPNTKFNAQTQQSGLTLLGPQSGDVYTNIAKLKLYPSGQGSAQYPNQVEQWLGARIAHLQSMHNIRVTVTVPGDSTRTVGDVVNLELPSPEQLNGTQAVYDRYYQGRYLVTSLRHWIDQNKYLTVLELVKDAVYSPFPS